MAAIVWAHTPDTMSLSVVCSPFGICTYKINGVFIFFKIPWNNHHSLVKFRHSENSNIVVFYNPGDFLLCFFICIFVFSKNNFQVQRFSLLFWKSSGKQAMAETTWALWMACDYFSHLNVQMNLTHFLRCRSLPQGCWMNSDNINMSFGETFLS